MKRELKCIKLVPEATIPSVATDLSACFDISACLHNEFVKINTGDQIIKEKPITDNSTDISYIDLRPHDTALIPTGLVFKIPEDMQMKIIPRSGYAWKNNITINNSPGTIDADYSNEVFVLLHNNSDHSTFKVYDGAKIAQGELEKNNNINLIISEGNFSDIETIKERSNRSGGFGSTGK